MNKSSCMKLALAVSVTLLVSACAKPMVVQAVKPGDHGLSCAQMQNEYADAERYRAEAEKEKGVTGGNVVRALFFWPAILGTASNANEAIAAADNRKVYLSNQMNQKGCYQNTGNAPVDQKAPEASPVSKVEQSPT